MNAADRIYMAGFAAALDMAEDAGACILAGTWGHPLRREHAAGGLLRFVDAAREMLAAEGIRQTATPSLATAANANHGSHSSATDKAEKFPPAGSFSERRADQPQVTRAAAVARGYTGDVCSECQNLTMVRNGTCPKCETCGSTTGCS